LARSKPHSRSHAPVVGEAGCAKIITDLDGERQFAHIDERR